MDPAAERSILRDLAHRQAELAGEPANRERRDLWTRLKDLDPVRPMILLEVWPIEDFVRPGELLCETPALRSVEYGLRMTLRHALEMGDDFVVPDRFKVDWIVRSGDYGEGLDVERRANADTAAIGYHFDHPIRSPEDLHRLRPRTHRIDRAASLARRDFLQDLLGDLLPVEMSGGLYHLGTTSELFKLIGNENLMVWSLDEPDAIRFLMDYLYEDRAAYIRTLEEEGVLTSNVRHNFVGSGSPGYTTSLPDPGGEVPVRFDQVWAWTEAQETEGMSPDTFRELFLPPMARLARQAGLVYYGCCERVDDRWEEILSAIPNIRAVSCSPWTRTERLAEQVGSRCVLSRKPTPTFISGANEWTEDVDREMRGLADAAARYGCPVEVIFRDLYTVGGDVPKLRRWTDRVRAILS